MFHLKRVNAQYQGKTVLKDITLHIPMGQKLALVGHSGSGKSTLLNVLYEQSPQTIALVPQDHGLVASLSVFHNVYMGQLGQQALWYNLLNLILPQKKSIAAVAAILNAVQLNDKIFEPVAQLSGGQQQRTAIARAMMHPGHILCADEIAASLDEQQSKRVMSLLCQQFETSVFALHDIDLALCYCDRIIGLEKGRIVIDAAAASLKRSDLLELYGT